MRGIVVMRVLFDEAIKIIYLTSASMRNSGHMFLGVEDLASLLFTVLVESRKSGQLLVGI